MHNFPIPWNKSSLNAFGSQTDTQRLLNPSLAVGWILFFLPKNKSCIKTFFWKAKKYLAIKGTDFFSSV